MPEESATRKKAGFLKKYVVTLGNITAWHIVSDRGFDTNQDTDYVALSVQGAVWNTMMPPAPLGQPSTKTYGPYYWRNGNETYLGLSSDPITVNTDSLFSRALIFSWAAVNKGTGDAESIINKMNGVVEQIGITIGTEADEPEEQLVSLVEGQLVNFFTAECDCALFAGTAMITADQLSQTNEGQGSWPAPWVPEAPNKWHAVFDYPNIAGGCSSGRYSLEIHVEQFDT